MGASFKNHLGITSAVSCSGKLDLINFYHLSATRTGWMLTILQVCWPYALSVVQSLPSLPLLWDSTWYSARGRGTGMLRLHDCMTAMLRLGHECFFGVADQNFSFQKVQAFCIGSYRFVYTTGCC